MAKTHTKAAKRRSTITRASSVITLSVPETKLRALVRDSIRTWGAMNQYEERTIEDEFIRRAGASASIDLQRAVALLDVLIAKVDSPDYSDIVVLRKVVRRYAVQSRELLSEVSP